MKASELQKKYPEFFVAVEAAVWDDLLLLNKTYNLKSKKSFNMHPDHAKRIAFNAAFSATCEYHRIASRKDNMIVGKTSHNSAMDAICPACKDTGIVNHGVDGLSYCGCPAGESAKQHQ